MKIKIINKVILLFLLVAGSLSDCEAQTNMTAPQVLSKTVNLISGSKGVEAKFKIYNSGYSGTGVITSTGGKFHVTLPDAETWYNGSDLYTLNKRTNEVTIVSPTKEELAESNPLNYVTGAASNYNVVFSTLKKAGKHVLELTPKKRGEIKRVTLTVSGKNYSPEKIVVEPTSGQPITADILSFNTAFSPGTGEYVFNKAKYPKVEVVDLR